MYEWIPVGEHTMYFDNPVKIGLFCTGDEAVLIDSGIDASVARKLLRSLEARGLRLTAICNTHSHADHTGGNAFLQARTGCRIFAPRGEAEIVRRPILEPVTVYGGNPPAALRHKMLLAQPSDALPLDAPDFPAALEPLALPGHSMDMTAYRTTDGVVFLGDCVSSRQTIEKYGIPFCYDIATFLSSLDRLETLEADCFVPSHTEVLSSADELRALVAVNRDGVTRVADAICEICRAPVTPDDLLAALFERFGLQMNFEQYAMVGSTVRSYLTWLQETGRVDAEFRDNRLFWRTLA